jgi:TIR domain
VASIFLCYRNGDGALAAALLDVMLSPVLGQDEVFRASRSIPPGDSYAEAIRLALKDCGTVLVIVGQRWLELMSSNRAVLPDGDGDWVRFEIVTALENGARIIPVLIEGVAPLQRSQLPADIAPLADLHYFRFNHRSIYRDAADLAAMLRSSKV